MWLHNKEGICLLGHLFSATLSFMYYLSAEGFLKNVPIFIPKWKQICG